VHPAPAAGTALRLTDLATRFPETVPDVPVLWAVVGNPGREAPFGRRIAVGP
jgi:hypothetical protein